MPRNTIFWLYPCIRCGERVNPFVKVVFIKGSVGFISRDESSWKAEKTSIFLVGDLIGSDF